MRHSRYDSSRHIFAGHQSQVDNEVADHKVVGNTMVQASRFYSLISELILSLRCSIAPRLTQPPRIGTRRTRNGKAHSMDEDKEGLVVMLLKEGSVGHAIRLYREETGADHEKAKHAVAELSRRHGVSARGNRLLALVLVGLAGLLGLAIAF